jgi:hypothetical protein
MKADVLTGVLPNAVLPERNEAADPHGLVESRIFACTCAEYHSHERLHGSGG